MLKTFCPNAKSPADKLAAVVVFPTPPFWLEIDIILVKTIFSNLLNHYSMYADIKYRNVILDIKYKIKFDKKQSISVTMRKEYSSYGWKDMGGEVLWHQ